MVQHIKINVHEIRSEPVDFLRGMMNLLDLDEYPMHKVHHLEFEAPKRVDRGLSYSSCAIESRREKAIIVEHYADLICTHMPNVTGLLATNVYETDGYSDFILAMTAHYSDKLRLYGTITSLSRHLLSFTSQLSELHLRFDSGSLANPTSFEVGTLRKIVLTSVPPNYRWYRIFNNNSSNSSFRFSNLESLQIIYEDNGGDPDDFGAFAEQLDQRSRIETNAVKPGGNSNREPRLEFPKLVKLDISFCTGTCIEFMDGVFSSALKVVDIHCTVKAAIDMAHIRLPKSIRKVSLILYMNGTTLAPREHAEMIGNASIRVANGFLGQFGESTKTSLSLSDSIPIADMSLARWTALDSLTLCTPITDTTLWQILARAPKLTSLVLYGLKTQTMPPNVRPSPATPASASESEPESETSGSIDCQQGLAVDLHIHLERIMIYCDYIDYSEEKDMSMLQKILLGIRSIKFINGVIMSDSKKQELVDTHLTKYPHLANVEIHGY
ncbi:hypothetical protein EV178_003647 [Coemansia sp. RSA 1646]|nr:hypothetical protein EV178_003647 [Coemansia sp. RSA 1646]